MAAQQQRPREGEKEEGKVALTKTGNLETIIFLVLKMCRIYVRTLCTKFYTVAHIVAKTVGILLVVLGLLGPTSLVSGARTCERRGNMLL